MTTDIESVEIKPRERLDFKLDQGLPRFWNGGDPYKTRFFDAMSLTFPIGERYFISTVRAYRDDIKDPKLAAEVKDFIRQEAQHGMVHAQFNDMLAEQGMAVRWTERFLDRKFKWQSHRWSKAFNLSYTAAAEHMTAMMCTTFVQRPDIFKNADQRMAAIYAWHSIEEIEHKAVAFDVLTKVAKANYFTRIAGLIYFSIEYPIGNWWGVNQMLKADGFGAWARAKMLLKGAWWLYKPGGVFMPVLGYYLSYFKPGFHPWQHKEMHRYEAWVEAYEKTGDPIKASEVFQDRPLTT